MKLKILEYERQMPNPTETTLSEAFDLGMEYQKDNDEEKLSDIADRLSAAIKEEDWDEVQNVVDDIPTLLED
jgi:hypothetical protein